LNDVSAVKLSLIKEILVYETMHGSMSLVGCAKEIPAMEKSKDKHLAGGGNWSFMQELSTRYCSAKFFPTESRADCDSTIETLKHLSRHSQALNRTETVKFIREECSKANYKKKHQVTARESELRENAEFERKRQEFEASPEGRAKAREREGLRNRSRRRNP
jgi:hypothetical protein